MKKSFITHSAKETRDFGKKFAETILPGTLVCLWGGLGVGKTTFTQGLLEGLGASRPYASPTFVIMKQYDLPSPVNGIMRIYHVDAYRVEAKDFEEIGFAEWLSDPQGVIILEWPERIEKILPKKRRNIFLKSTFENDREIVAD